LREEAPVGQGAEVLYLRAVLDHGMGELDRGRRILRQAVGNILVPRAVRAVRAYVERGGRVDERRRKVREDAVPARGAAYARRGGTRAVRLHPRRERPVDLEECGRRVLAARVRSEEHTSELQSR